MHLSEYQEVVLRELIKKYEERSDYGKTDKHARRTILPVNKVKFPLYYHDTDSEFRMTMNRELVDLEQRRLIQLDWMKFCEGEELKRIILNDVQLKQIYSLLGIEPKINKYNLLIDIVRRYAAESPEVLYPFLNETIERLEQFKSVPSIIDVDSIDNTADHLKGLNAFLQEREFEIPRRKWSIQLYNDSKKWEKIESKLLSVVKMYVYGDVEIDDEEILTEWGIVDNPQLIYVYGSISFENNDQTLDLSLFENSFGLDTNFVKKSRINSLDSKCVVTVENLTSYYEYINYVKNHNFNYLVVYLGGFHNSIRRLLLQKISDFIKENNLNVTFYHWGDIDVGGFRIWKHLSDKINIPIFPLLMDGETFTRHMNYGKPIVKVSYIKQLEKMLEDESYQQFHAVIRMILTNKITIEQEIISLAGNEVLENIKSHLPN